MHVYDCVAVWCVIIVNLLTYIYWNFSTSCYILSQGIRSNAISLCLCTYTEDLFNKLEPFTVIVTKFPCTFLVKILTSLAPYFWTLDYHMYTHTHTSMLQHKFICLQKWSSLHVLQWCGTPAVLPLHQWPATQSGTQQMRCLCERAPDGLLGDQETWNKRNKQSIVKHPKQETTNRVRIRRKIKPM